MSFSRLRPYFKERLVTVDPELAEWEDAFNEENIPATVIDKAYHLAFGPGLAGSLNQDCLPFTWNVTLNIYLKGYSTPKDAVDTALSTSEAILKECLKHSNRLADSAVNAARIVNVKSTSIVLAPLATSNDNIVKLTMGFTCEVHIEIS